MSHLTDIQVASQLEDLTGWTQQGNAIVKAFEFEDFIEAISFMTQVAFHAQEMQHYPEWTNIYNKVHVKLMSYDIKGISSRDILLAKRMERIFDTGHANLQKVNGL